MRRIEVLVLAALVAGCGGERPRAVPADADAAVAPPEASAADLAAADVSSAADFATRYCALLAPCCSDQERCRQAVATMSPYRAGAAEDCLAALRTATALCTTGFRAAAAACQRVFAAKVATQRLGQPCTQDADCLLSPQGAVRCAGSGMGRCQVIVTGQAGSAPCVATTSGPLTVPGGDLESTSIMGYRCDGADGLWCDDASGKCTAIKAAGATCTSFGECGPTGSCDDNTGKCTGRKKEGDACTVDEECPSTVCGEDNRCAPPPAVDGALVQLCSKP